MSDMRITYLSEKPEVMPVLAEWDHNEWGWLHPSQTIESNITWLKDNMGSGGVPSMFLALDHDKPVGMVGLTGHDLDTRPDLTPWLASLYVEAAYRKHGIGRALVDRVRREASAAGYNRLYLHTLDQEDFYTRLGWETIGPSIFYNQPVTVMAINL